MWHTLLSAHAACANSEGTRATRSVRHSGVAARRPGVRIRWAEARVKITRMTLTIKLDRNWSSFQLANSAPPLSVTGSAIAPSARMTLPAAGAPAWQHCLRQSLAAGAARCCCQGGKCKSARPLLRDDSEQNFHGHGVGDHRQQQQCSAAHSHCPPCIFNC